MQWTDICNTRCSILSRFSHFHVLHFPPCILVPHFHVPQFHVSHFQRLHSASRRINLAKFATCRLRERLIGNESVPIQLAQCWFSRPAIPMPKYKYIFSNKMHRRNFMKQHSETCYGWKLAKCWLQFKIKFYCVIYYNFSAHFRSLLRVQRIQRKVLI